MSDRHGLARDVNIFDKEVEVSQIDITIPTLPATLNVVAVAARDTSGGLVGVDLGVKAIHRPDAKSQQRRNAP